MFARGRKLYAKIQDVNGKWLQLSTGLDVGQEAEALKWIAERERKVSVKRPAPAGPVTVSAYAQKWLDKRKTASVGDDKNRIERHALPHIGTLAMTDVRPVHLRDLIMALRNAGELAPTTIRQVSGVLHTMFKSATIEGVIPSNPVIFERGVLPKKVDKDPTWRHQAIFARPEVEQILSDTRLPFDRRVIYAMKFFTGRHSEVAHLTWAQYDATTKPLGALQLGYTKSGVPRLVPVHPVLARFLKLWREQGWPAFYGRNPEPADMIVTTRKGRRKKADETQKQFVKDLEKIGLRTSAGKTRNRRGHDLRRTLITLARTDGATDQWLRWITHGPKSGEMLDTYSTPPWEVLCATIAKLRITVKLGAVLVQSRKTVARVGLERFNERPRRDSKTAKVLSGAARCESDPDVTRYGIARGRWHCTKPMVQAIPTSCDEWLTLMMRMVT